jgi:hypothetical protein
MPTSALLQLVARGRLDAYLTGQPQTSFFHYVHQRHRPFAMESIPIDFEGNIAFGNQIRTIIPRYADLISSLFIEVDLPGIPNAFWVNDIGNALIRDISVEIGDREFDKQTGEWMFIWNKLSLSGDLRNAYDEMIGHWSIYNPPAELAGKPITLTIPLNFWFCNNIGAALPLIALQSHPVRIIVNLRPFNELWWSPNIPTGLCNAIAPVEISRFQMFGDYIYLDTDERRRIAAGDHEYLIEQVQIATPQSVGVGVNKASVPLYFNHCCKEFIWTIQQTRMKGLREWFNYADTPQYGWPGGTQDQMTNALLRLDGNDRFYVRNAPYFRLTQPFLHHTNAPTPPDYIYLYSFSLDPEDAQPSGSLNCSKIEDIVFHLNFDTDLLKYERTVQFYATNYNVLRIVGGMGGLVFIA